MLGSFSPCEFLFHVLNVRRCKAARPEKQAACSALMHSPQPPHWSEAHISESRCWGWAPSGTGRSHHWLNPDYIWSGWWGVPGSRVKQLLQSNNCSAENQIARSQTWKRYNRWKLWFKGFVVNCLIKRRLPYQTSPFDECVGYRAPISQLVIHLRIQQQEVVSLGRVNTANIYQHIVCNVVSTPYQMPDCQQVLPGYGVSAWTRHLSHSQREAQEHKHTQTLYLQLTQPYIILSLCSRCILLEKRRAEAQEELSKLDREKRTILPTTNSPPWECSQQMCHPDLNYFNMDAVHIAVSLSLIPTQIVTVKSFTRKTQVQSKLKWKPFQNVLYSCRIKEQIHFFSTHARTVFQHGSWKHSSFSSQDISPIVRTAPLCWNITSDWCLTVCDLRGT